MIDPQMSFTAAAHEQLAEGAEPAPTVNAYLPQEYKARLSAHLAARRKIHAAVTAYFSIDAAPVVNVDVLVDKILLELVAP